MSTRITAVWAGVVAAALCGSAAAQGQSEILERSDPRDWTLTVTLGVRAYETRDPRTKMPVRDEWNFESAAVVFPMLRDSASHRLDEKNVTSRLTANDRLADDQVALIPQIYHSGTRLGKWELKGWKGEELKLDVTLPVTTWRTTFDETAAERIGWPKGEWPPQLKSTFEPMMFIDMGMDGEPYDPKPVADLLKKYTRGNDPKKLPPVKLAKFLAGEVWKDFQPSGEGMEFDRTGLLEGIELQPIAETIKRRRGSDFDVVNVLLALYRQAGLPARLVIGYDVGPKMAGFLERKSDNEEGLRAWVEFALWTEGMREPIWVPVDVLAMRGSSSRPRPLDQPWEYFGTHEELDAVIPLAFQYHPPTSVRAYGTPGLWGWMVLPEPPSQAEQTLRFKVTSTPKRGGDRDREREQEENERPGRGRRRR